MRRTLAALALGGLLGCTAFATTAGAAATAADSTGIADSPGSSPSMQISAGVFALVEAYDYPYNVGASYVARPFGAWRLAPGAGIALGPDGIAFAYLAGTHISNAGLSHPNNGTETLLLMLTLPLAR
jgi:hypothetical protein